jgi:hypothetical protein
MRRPIALALVCLSAAVPGLILWFTEATDPAVTGPVMRLTGVLAALLLMLSLGSASAPVTRAGRVPYRLRAVIAVAGLAATLLHLGLAEAVPRDMAVLAVALVSAAAGAVLSLPLVAPAVAGSRLWMRVAAGAPGHALPIAAVAGAVLLALHGALSLDGGGEAWVWLHMLPLLLMPAAPLLRQRTGEADAWG